MGCIIVENSGKSKVKNAYLKYIIVGTPVSVATNNPFTFHGMIPTIFKPVSPIVLAR